MQASLQDLLVNESLFICASSSTFLLVLENQVSHDWNLVFAGPLDGPVSRLGLFKCSSLLLAFSAFVCSMDLIVWHIIWNVYLKVGKHFSFLCVSILV